jgi:branched-chain amino acid transport system substrate-binding protein
MSMKSNRRKFLLMSVSGAASLAMPNVIRAQDAELRIGMLAALSGPITAWGLASMRGAQMAFDAANKAGGVQVGGTKMNVKFIPYDDQFNAAQASAQANRLISQDRVSLILGPIGSPPSLGALPVTQPAKALQLCDGFAPGILRNEWNGAYAFRLIMTPGEFADGLIGWYKKNLPQVKRIGLISPNDSVGQLVMPLYTSAYQKHGFEVFSEFYERGSKEFTPLILRLNAQKIDAIDLTINPPGDAGLLMRQGRQAGFRGQFMQSGGAGADELIGVAGSAAEGLLYYDPLNLEIPQVREFQEAYVGRWGGVMNAQAPTYFAMGRVVMEAVRRAGTSDATKVRDEILQLPGFDTGVFGKFGLTGREAYGVNHQVVWPYYLKQVEGGRPVLKASF